MSDDSRLRNYRSHFVPRTKQGWVAVLSFAFLFLLVEPPLLFYANSIEPWLFDLPALYLYLSVVYIALVAVLLWAYIREL